MLDKLLGRKNKDSRESPAPEGSAEASLRLQLYDREHQLGELIDLGDFFSEYTLGRAEDCSIQILEDDQMSRRHLILDWRGDRLLATDLSSNGVLRAGARLEKGVPTPLNHHEELHLTSRLRLVLDWAPGAKVARPQSDRETVRDEEEKRNPITRGGTVQFTMPAEQPPSKARANAGSPSSKPAIDQLLAGGLEPEKLSPELQAKLQNIGSPSASMIELKRSRDVIPITAEKQRAAELAQRRSTPEAQRPPLVTESEAPPSAREAPLPPLEVGPGGTLLINGDELMEGNAPTGTPMLKARPGGTQRLDRSTSGEVVPPLSRSGSGEAPRPSGSREQMVRSGPTFGSEQGRRQQIDAYTKLRQDIHGRIHNEIQRNRGEADLEQRVRQLLTQVLKELYASKTPPPFDEDRLRLDIINELLYLGPIQVFMEDPGITEIMVAGCDKIFVERNGLLERTDRSFPTDYVLRNVIDRIVEHAGRKIDMANPMVDARLPDGSRVNAVIPPVAITGPTLTIRKFRAVPFQLTELVARGSLSDRMARLLERCVRARKNMIISGGTGSGKTSLLNTLSSHVGEFERIVTIEDAAELQLQKEHVISLEARMANVEGKGEIRIRDLLRNALRMRPDRIIVGECRGAEVLDMLQAMNTGHEGSLTTAHANSPEDLLNRLEIMVLQAVDMPVSAIRDMIGSTLEVVVQLTRLSDGRRLVSSISEVAGYDRRLERIVIKEIFRFDREGFDESGRVRGEFRMTGHLPSFLHEFKMLGLIDGEDYI
jgi:pilus assembly protein CpaF